MVTVQPEHIASIKQAPPFPSNTGCICSSMRKVYVRVSGCMSTEKEKKISHVNVQRCLNVYIKTGLNLDDNLF